jgi:adenylyl/guanylyl cyclase-like protein with sensor domain
MKKQAVNNKLRECVNKSLSLSQENRSFVSKIYDSFKNVLNNSCIQIGSYPRFTAIKPLHDLDILYLLGHWDEYLHDPSEQLEILHRRIKNEYENPTRLRLEISIQTHSVGVSFINGDFVVFSVDIVPAYSYSKNEFGQDMYMVPEIVRQKHGVQRVALYERLASEHQDVQWIASDPRGYIEVAKTLNSSNADFRRSVKFVKGWKNACKGKLEDFALKSFHIEQIVTKVFQDNPEFEIFDGVFRFFVTLPERINKPSIPDRANKTKYIDSYLNDLSKEQKNAIIQARDYFLKSLEEISEDDTAESLLDINFYKRVSTSEQFLFDFNIPTLTEKQFSFTIIGEAPERNDGSFRKMILDKIGKILINREVYFKTKGSVPNVDLFKWKVRNDDNSPQPRGEITDHTTKNDPEHTKYVGEHFVECYAILDNICVAKARQQVRLGRKSA